MERSRSPSRRRLRSRWRSTLASRSSLRGRLRWPSRRTRRGRRRRRARRVGRRPRRYDRGGRARRRCGRGDDDAAVAGKRRQAGLPLEITSEDGTGMLVGMRRAVLRVAVGVAQPLRPAGQAGTDIIPGTTILLSSSSTPEPVRHRRHPSPNQVRHRRHASAEPGPSSSSSMAGTAPLVLMAIARASAVSRSRCSRCIVFLLFCCSCWALTYALPSKAHAEEDATRAGFLTADPSDQRSTADPRVHVSAYRDCRKRNRLTPFVAGDDQLRIASSTADYADGDGLRGSNLSDDIL